MPSVEEYATLQIQENNEIVLVNPFYETTESTRQVLSSRNPDLDVSKHEKEESLIIIDSLDEYFDKPSDGMPKKKEANMSHYFDGNPHFCHY